MRNFFILLVFLTLCGNISAQAQMYFPPATGIWETIAPSDLGFCPDRIDSLYGFLERTHTKGFLLLQDGKIVLEKYYGSFTQDSAWYWASAGKSLSAYLVGIAAEQNNLNLTAPVSTYLGNGWTTAPPDKESLIQVQHLLSMSSGLNDAVQVPGVTEPANCLQPECLQYLADAGTRWAYHNAPYHLSHNVIEKASGSTLNQFTQTRLFNRIGAKGLWLNHVMYSTPRNMARFGLLALAQGKWGTDTIIRNQSYLTAMSNTSQAYNKSYGYLWWLNGKQNFMLPSVQLIFPGMLFNNAPLDMYSALGKNDQKIHVVPSKRWVVIRMGNDSGVAGPFGGTQVPIYFDIDLWDYLNSLSCASDLTHDVPVPEISVSPNPTAGTWRIVSGSASDSYWRLIDTQGRVLRTGFSQNEVLEVDAQGLPGGIYWFQMGSVRLKCVKF